MPVLFSSTKLNLTENLPCDATFDQFDAGRESFIINYSDLIDEAQKFQEQVIDVLSVQNPGLKIGKYFIVKVSELQALIDMSDGANYLQFHNGIAANNMAILYANPITRDFAIADKPTTIIVASLPCPPDPRCPRLELGSVV